jgi:hypothetical protein
LALAKYWRLPNIGFCQLLAFAKYWLLGKHFVTHGHVCTPFPSFPQELNNEWAIFLGGYGAITWIISQLVSPKCFRLQIKEI